MIKNNQQRLVLKNQRFLGNVGRQRDREKKSPFSFAMYQ